MTPEYLSVSQVQTFDPSTYGGCNRKWYFGYVLKIPSPQTQSQKTGEDGHKRIEHYLKTGEDVLGILERAGKHFMPAPKVRLLLEHPIHGGKGLLLTAGGVPFKGYIDVVNEDETYMDDEGVIHDDDNRIEIIDWKFLSNLQYAKSGKDLIDSTQMIGYAEWARRNYEHRGYSAGVRLSHGTFQTVGARGARKSTVALDWGRVQEEWEKIEPVVASLKIAAEATRVEDVDPNYAACDAYKGCPHRSICPRSAEAKLFSILGHHKGKGGTSMGVSLLSKFKRPPATAEVATEVKKLKAEEAAAINPPDAPKSEPPGSAKPFSTEEKLAMTPEIAEASKKWDPPAEEQAAEKAVAATTTAKRRGRPKVVTPVAENPHAVMPIEAVEKHVTTAPPVLETDKTMAASALPAHKMIIFSDVVYEGFFGFQDLAPYVRGLCEKLEKEFNAADIRCAPKDSVLAFGGWRGVLAAAVRAEPPAAGFYRLDVRMSEIHQVVLETLRAHGASTVRGGL
jgi:hypothetical protein